MYHRRLHNDLSMWILYGTNTHSTVLYITVYTNFRLSDVICIVKAEFPQINGS